jgi:hypothetical protein
MLKMNNFNIAIVLIRIGGVTCFLVYKPYEFATKFCCCNLCNTSHGSLDYGVKG